MASQVMRIVLKAYDHQLVDASASKIIETVKKNGATVSGPVPLPTKKEVVTILRAVHKYKDSREQFEQRTHKRLIDIITPTQNQNDMQQGEVYDARFEGSLTGWHGVRAYRDDLPITGMNTVPILEHEAFPGKLLQTPNGETVLDFGQNIAGYVEMALTARAGQKVKLTCGEALDENGNFTQENFQDRARHKEGGTAQMLDIREDTVSWSVKHRSVRHWQQLFLCSHHGIRIES